MGITYDTPVSPDTLWAGDMKHVIIICIAAFVGAVIGIILYFSVLHRDNEGKYTGLKAKLYNLMNFNRFYLEDMLRFLYILLACMLAVMGIVNLVTGSIFVGLMELVVGNIVLRIVTELLMMLLILCRKTVSIDHKLDKIRAFYEDDFDDGVCADIGDGAYNSCGEAAAPMDGVASMDSAVQADAGSPCRACASAQDCVVKEDAAGKAK